LDRLWHQKHGKTVKIKHGKNAMQNMENKAKKVWKKCSCKHGKTAKQNMENTLFSETRFPCFFTPFKRLCYAKK